jgi:hypothetical protein
MPWTGNDGSTGSVIFVSILFDEEDYVYRTETYSAAFVPNDNRNLRKRKKVG